MGQEEKEQEQEQCSEVYNNLQKELILKFKHLKQDNYKKRAVPKRCFHYGGGDGLDGGLSPLQFKKTNIIVNPFHFTYSDMIN